MSAILFTPSLHDHHHSPQQNKNKTTTTTRSRPTDWQTGRNCGCIARKSTRPKAFRPNLRRFAVGWVDFRVKQPDSTGSIWLIGWSTDPLICWLTDCPLTTTDWLTDWLIYWPTNWLNDWLTAWIIAYRSFRYKVVSLHRSSVDSLRFKIDIFSNIWTQFASHANTVKRRSKLSSNIREYVDFKT